MSETVWLVYGQEHESIHLVAVFDNREAAENSIEQSCSGEDWRESYRERYYIEEFELKTETEEFGPYL